MVFYLCKYGIIFKMWEYIGKEGSCIAVKITTNYP